MKRQNSVVQIGVDTVKKAWKITLCLVFAVVGAISFALIPPLVLERIINQLTKGQAVALQLAVLYFAMLVVAGFFDAFKEMMITIFGQRVTRNIRSAMDEKLLYLKADYYTSHETGKITSRFVNDVDAVESLFNNGIISMFADGCKIASIIVVVFIKSKGLGCLLLVVTPFLLWMTRCFQKRMLCAQIENRKAISKVNNHIPETLHNIRMIHILHREKYMEKRYATYIQESYRATDQSNLYDSIYSPIIIFTSSLLIAVMMVLASMGGDIQQFFGMSVGTAVAVIAYVSKVFEPLEIIGMEIQNIQSAVAGIKRIDQFLREEEKVPVEQEIQAIQLRQEAERRGASCISFQKVSFGYQDNQKILSDFQCEIQAGENVVLAGRTGAGKSTIFRLIMGLYSPNQGQVQIYGKQADRIPEQEKRKLFGYVEQSFHPVQGNIAQQISLSDSSITEKMVQQAAELVGLHEDILRLPKGYNTVMTEVNLSQGQLQLLSIARAVVADPAIMLLDEITANLDSKTEKDVMEALKKASENRTVVSISHRLYEQGLNCRRISLS